MTSEQITNRQIKQFFETYISGKKGVYFIITTGSIYDQKLHPFNPKTEEFTGETMFLKTLEAVFDENHYQIGIEVYEKATKNIKADPFYHKTFVLQKEPVKKQDSGLNGLGLGDFGGIEGILDTKLSAKYLSGENERLKKENEKLEKLNNKLTEKTESFSKMQKDLENDVKTKDWELKNLIEDHKRAINNIKDDHKRSLEGIEDKNNKFEKILTIGGIIAAKTAGIEEGDLKGILGIENPQTDENDKKESSTPDNIDFKETKEYTGKKAEAKNFVDSINNVLIEIIDANNEEDAYKIIASFYNIVGFANTSIDNLTKLNNIVISGFSKKEKTAADTIIEKANNYSKED